MARLQNIANLVSKLGSKIRYLEFLCLTWRHNAKTRTKRKLILIVNANRQQKTGCTCVWVNF